MPCFCELSFVGAVAAAADGVLQCRDPLSDPPLASRTNFTHIPLATHSLYMSMRCAVDGEGIEAEEGSGCGMSVTPLRAIPAHVVGAGPRGGNPAAVILPPPPPTGGVEE